MTENNQNNNNSGQTNVGLLQGLKNKIFLRAAFCVVILLLTAVLLFSMTAAWYTNVADTGGLIFVANQWGFDGSIIIESDVIDMAPGDSGIVSMQIANTGSETASAGVTVSKANLNELMKKRLYFYVDTTLYRNSEKMERVYVSSTGGYTYTVFPGSQIYITQQSQNAPALRWEWVYDVLGYYVYGRITDSSVQIDEYIRPIEYAFDPITTTFAEDGTLKTIDGVQSAGDFLVKLSETDGYYGTIDPTERTEGGYYPVYVNSEGYGVWAYLCTYSEIMQNIEDDTAIGTSTTTESHSVAINVTGSNSGETAVNVDDADSLASIIATTGYANLRLTQDITLDNILTVKTGYRADIDLNGHTLTLGTNGDIFADVGSKLTLENGKILGGGRNYGVVTSGAELVMNNVIIDDVNYGVRVSDYQNSTESDSRVHISNSQILGDSIAVWIYANNGESDSLTTVIVEGSRLVGGDYGGIVVNGSYKNTEIQVLDCTVSGLYTAIYQPQQDTTLRIERSSLSGITGLVVKGGLTIVHDSVVTGTGAVGQIYDPEYSISGFTDTGDGIYLEANYTWETEIRITGNSVVTSANAHAVRKYMPDAENANIYISSGSFNTDVSDYLADGAEQNENADGEFVVHMTE